MSPEWQISTSAPLLRFQLPVSACSPGLEFFRCHQTSSGNTTLSHWEWAQRTCPKPVLQHRRACSRWARQRHARSKGHGFGECACGSTLAQCCVGSSGMLCSLTDCGLLRLLRQAGSVHARRLAVHATHDHVVGSRAWRRCAPQHAFAGNRHANFAVLQPCWHGALAG